MADRTLFKQNTLVIPLESNLLSLPSFFILKSGEELVGQC